MSFATWYMALLMVLVFTLFISESKPNNRFNLNAYCVLFFLRYWFIGCHYVTWRYRINPASS
jgi:hypothetical protein